MFISRICNSSPLITPFFSRQARFFATRDGMSFDAAEKAIDGRLEEVLNSLRDRRLLVHQSREISISRMGCAIEFPTWLPGYMIKLDPMSRIEGAKEIVACTREMNLDLIVVPEQRPYFVPEKYRPIFSATTLCLSEKIEGEQNLPLTLRQVKQLVAIVQKIGAGDLKSNNLVHCLKERIAIIDTEKRGKKSEIYALKFLLENNVFFPDAEEYLIEMIGDR